jgi:hypothetical protein
MRMFSRIVAAGLISLMTAQAAVAQPGPRDRRPPPPSHDGAYRPGPQAPERYYYNGRWVDAGEWGRHSRERDRWARNYEQRRDRDHHDSSALVAGILGFALGAAIVGSAHEADRARTADASWDDRCAKKYRSYDRHSRTYLGADGLRHYCQ